MTDTDLLSDWALIQQYIDHGRAFVDPFLFNTLRRRGIAWVINDLGGKPAAQAKCAAYGRLLRAGKVFGEEQIDEVAHHVEAISKLQRQVADAAPGDVIRLVELAVLLGAHAQAAADFF